MYKFEEARQEHIARHGSFLYCPERDNYCFFMAEVWNTGEKCSRAPCIVDDPEYIKLQERIDKNRERRTRREEAMKAAEEKEERAQIRRQTKSRKDVMLERIRVLEEESEAAYRRNRPRIGAGKLEKAMALRRQLRGDGVSDV